MEVTIDRDYLMGESNYENLELMNDTRPGKNKSDYPNTGSMNMSSDDPSDTSKQIILDVLSKEEEIISIFKKNNFEELLKFDEFNFEVLINSDYLIDIFGSGFFKIIEHMIVHGYNLEARNNKGYDLIHLSCRFGLVNIIRLLSSKGVQLEIKNTNVLQPIHLACFYGQYEIAKFLLVSGVNPEANDNYNWKPIHYACVSNNLNIIKLLKRYRIDIESLTIDNKRPIHLACSSVNTRIVKYLVDGFFDESNQFYNIRPQINLVCKDLNGKKPIDYLADKESKSKKKLFKYIKKKIEIKKRTIFRVIPLVLQDIIFI